MSPSTETRERILDSARSLIYARSYADVGVAEICSHAEVKKGSFYHFFPSKRDLTLAVLESTFSDLKRDLLDRAFASDVGPLQRLRRFVKLSERFQAEFYRETGAVPGCQFGNLAAEQSTQDEVLRDKVAELFERIRCALRDTLQDAVAAAEVGDIDVEATASAMLAYFEGVILLAKTRNDPAVLAQLLPAMLDVQIGAARNGT